MRPCLQKAKKATRYKYGNVGIYFTDRSRNGILGLVQLNAETRYPQACLSQGFRFTWARYRREEKPQAEQDLPVQTMAPLCQSRPICTANPRPQPHSRTKMMRTCVLEGPTARRGTLMSKPLLGSFSPRRAGSLKGSCPVSQSHTVFLMACRTLNRP